MNQVHYSDKDYSIHIPKWEDHLSYWRLEREESPEEADEMERLKEKQRQIERDRSHQQNAEQPQGTSLPEPEQVEAWPA